MNDRERVANVKAAIKDTFAKRGVLYDVAFDSDLYAAAEAAITALRVEELMAVLNEASYLILYSRQMTEYEFIKRRTDWQSRVIPLLPTAEDGKDG